jgi:hypothetical protein
LCKYFTNFVTFTKLYCNKCIFQADVTSKFEREEERGKRKEGRSRKEEDERGERRDGRGVKREAYMKSGIDG